MENNNYNENNNANTSSTGTDNVNADSVNQNSVADTSADQGRQESSSSYGYSYIKQEHKNPNNIWRADENTAQGYGSTYGSSQTYSNGAYQSQTDTGSTYGQNNTGSTYGGQTNAGSSGTQSNVNGTYNAYDQSYTASGSAYGSQTGSAYNQNQTNAGSTYNQAQSNAGSTYSQTQTDQTGSAYNHAGSAYNQNQTGAGSAYGSTQPGSENNYSSIYGSADAQGSFQSYADAKKQKKEERARKRAEKRAGSSTGFGVKLAKCASIALVFGLVAGTTFEGSSYLVGSLLGTDGQEESVAQDQDKEVLHTTDGEGKSTVQPTSTPVSDGVEGIVKEVMPSIVAITNMSQGQYRNFFGQIQSYEQPSAGSGIIVSEDEDYLYIATNNHVVSGATSLTIQFNDRKSAAAEIKGTDKSTDLAVVKVKKSDIESDTLAAIKVATFSSSDVEVGSRAIAIGNALGYGQSVTGGYISAVDREVTMQDETTGESFTNELIQTDAAINPGNSGGALLNVYGEVIGINSSKYSDTTVEGMGFAIPANTAKQIIEDLITKEKVSDEKAAYLGIYGEDVSSQIAAAYNMPEGIFVKEVIKGSAADQYGIAAGDIITQFDGKKIKLMETLHSRLAYYEGGQEVEIVIQRPQEGGYKEMTVSVVLGKKNS